MMVPKKIENNNNTPLFSFIIPIFERENELKELLESMSTQTLLDFEVIIVDDGSKNNLNKAIEQFKDQLHLHYFYKNNEGASLARNFGAKYAQGEYLLFIDSDCILPNNYIENIIAFLKKEKVYFFGGPDDASKDFNNTQKALSYAMTGFFTTGGIRGGKVNKNYQPRSFNMGILTSLFKEIGGFKNINIGEDVDLSLRIIEKRFIPSLIFNAKVYHKRRINLVSFAKRVYSFGKMRPILMNWHPFSTKIVFYFPTFFLLGTVALIGLSFFNLIFILPIFIWMSCVLIESTIKYNSILVAILSLLTSFIQLFAYGLGFLISYTKSLFFK